MADGRGGVPVGHGREPCATLSNLTSEDSRLDQLGTDGSLGHSGWRKATNLGSWMPRPAEVQAELLLSTWATLASIKLNSESSVQPRMYLEAA